MTIDPTYRFIIGLFITFAIGVSQGTVSLTNAIPADLIKPVVAWCGILAFLGSAATTAISGIGMSNQNRIASAAVIPEVKAIVTTPEIANAAGSNGTGAKVVSQ